MSKTKDSQSITAIARASAASALEHFMEIKKAVPARVKHFREYLRDGPAPRGRPKGKLQYDDELYLIEMGRLLETGKARNLHHAATIVVAQNSELTPPTIEEDSVVRRLSDAFKKDAALYRFPGQGEPLTTSGKAAR